MKCHCGCGEETKIHLGRSNKYIHGHNNPALGIKHSEESKKKQSVNNTKTFLLDYNGNKEIFPSIPTLCACGCNEIVYKVNRYKRGHISRLSLPINNLKIGWDLNQTEIYKKLHSEIIERIPRMRLFGKEHPRWNGGKKIRVARANYKRLDRGFVLLTLNNPYNEPVDFHHIDPNLPYVVPCPKRIHEMFTGNHNYHHQNVNYWLGIIRVGD